LTASWAGERVGDQQHLVGEAVRFTSAASVHHGFVEGVRPAVSSSTAS